MNYIPVDRFALAAQRVVTNALEQDELPAPRDIAYPGYSLADGWRLTLAVERDANMLLGITDPLTWTDRISEVR